MKRILLIAMLSLAALGVHAQSKTTGSVSLTTGMTAKLDLNNDTSTATLTLTGPQDRWIAIQFGSFTGGMAPGTDLVYYNGTTLVDASQNGVGATPSIDAVNNWTVSSNTVSGNTRTIIATRAFTGGTGDYNFVYTNTEIDFVWARGSSASFAIANHGSNRGFALNKTFSCIPPAAPTAAAQAFCSGATVANLTATGLNGATFNWYTAATGGSALASTTTLTGTTYYVAQTLSACESDRTPVVVTITTVNQPTATAQQNFCTSATVANLSATGQTGATVSWYAAATGGSALAGTTALTTGTTYYVGQTLNTCTSTRTPVTVTITTAAAPTASAQVFCEGATVANLTAIGTGIKWYSVATGGTQLAGTAVLTAGTYYATQTVNTCESTTTPVTVTINAASVTPTGAGTQDFTEGQTIADLEVTTATGATVTWYTLSGTVFTEVPVTTVLTDDTTYYVSQDTNGCESAKLPVAVNQALGTQDVSLKGLKVYPNPSSDVVTIAHASALSNVLVINMLGQEVASKKATDNSVQVNVSQLTAGTYILKVTAADGGTATVRVIKQ